LGATRLPALGSGGGFGVEGAGPCGGDGERGGAGGGGQGCGSSGGGEADGGDGRGGSRWGVGPASCSPPGAKSGGCSDQARQERLRMPGCTV